MRYPECPSEEQKDAIKQEISLDERSKYFSLSTVVPIESTTEKAMEMVREWYEKWEVIQIGRYVDWLILFMHHTLITLYFRFPGWLQTKILVDTGIMVFIIVHDALIYCTCLHQNGKGLACGRHFVLKLPLFRCISTVWAIIMTIHVLFLSYIVVYASYLLGMYVCMYTHII